MTRQQRVYGVTKCMECHKAFLPCDEIRETVVDDHPWRATSVPGYRVRSAATVKVTTRWHAACLAEVERWIAESRADYERQRQADIDAIRAAITGGAS